MKKIIITSIAAVSLISGVVFADSAPAKSGIILSGAGFWTAPTGTVDQVDGYPKVGEGFGVGAYVGYDYAITEHITVGAKGGYNYSMDLLKDKNSSLNASQIPLMLTGKYFFDSGWLVGAEGGINWQKLSASDDNATISSNSWNIAPIAGLMGGYQWKNGISLTGNADYIFGKDVQDMKDKSDTLGNLQVGVQVSYLLPM